RNGASGASTATAHSQTATTSRLRRYIERPREANRAAGTRERYPPHPRPSCTNGGCGPPRAHADTERTMSRFAPALILLALLATGAPQPAGAATAACTAHATRLRYRPEIT